MIEASLYVVVFLLGLGGGGYLHYRYGATVLRIKNLLEGK